MADTYILPAYALYTAPHFTGFDNNNQIAINVIQIDAFSPRYAWLKRYLVPGQNQIQYLLTFEPNSLEVADPNILQGVYIEQDGKGVLIDCISVDNFIAAADGLGTITRRYAAGVPAFVTPTPTCYIIARIDNATGSDMNDVVMGYVTQYIGNVQFVSHVTGTSLYRIYSYTVPVGINGDQIESC